MLNAGLVNEPRLEYLPAEKIANFCVFAGKSAIQKVR
jgi:hypothetical protein